MGRMQIAKNMAKHEIDEENYNDDVSREEYIRPTLEQLRQKYPNRPEYKYINEGEKGSLEEVNEMLVQDLLSPLQDKLIKLLQSGSMTREEICDVLGFEYQEKYTNLHKKRTTIHDNLVKLQKKQIVEKYVHNNRKRGRPIVLFRLKI